MSVDPLRQAASNYLAALDDSRQPYVPTARNAPDPGDVRAVRIQRLARAEQQLRDVLEETDGGGTAA